MMETVRSETMDINSENETNGEFRVRVTSKKQVTEQINKYKEVLKTVLNGQEVAEDTKKVLLQELLANFEAAVHDNVLVNGQSWEEAPDDGEEEGVDLNSLLDDVAVETSRKRRTFPKKILPHVVHSLKADRKLLNLYEQTVRPEEMVKDPEQECIMGDLSSAAPGMVKQAIQVIKSIQTLQLQTEGLCEVLSVRPSVVSMEIHREVLGQSQASVPPRRHDNGPSQQPIRRKQEEKAARDCYVPK